MTPRRSRFELCMEIIGLCRSPGLPLSRLSSNARLNSPKLKDILMELISGELIEVETRPLSYVGDKRQTDYYIMTPDGGSLVRDFEGLRARLTSEGARSRSG